MAPKKIKVAELDLLMGRDDTVEITPTIVDHSAEIAALEALDALDEAPAVDDPDAKWLQGVQNAQARLGEFKLSPLANTILQRACENVAGNKGFAPRPESRGAEREREEQQRVNTLERAALFNAYDADLIEVLGCAAAVHDVETLPGVAYSTCFAVQKAANFVANLLYRKALDKADGEGPAAHDHREMGVPPCGLGEDDEPLVFDGVVEHADTRGLPHHEVLGAYEDVHLYLQLLTELHGWDVDAPMPYMYVSNTDGTFAPVWGAEQTLDMMEVRAKASATKRIARQTAAMSVMLAHARNTVLKAGRRAAA